jgi:hypothetical protein
MGTNFRFMRVRSSKLKHISEPKRRKIRRERTKNVRTESRNAPKPLI